MGSGDLFAALCAGMICLGGWAVLAAGAAWGAHRRVRSVERALGRRAQPDGEEALLWYAGAATTWPAAAGLALLGLVQRERARSGRNCFYIMLAHFTAAILGALAVTIASAEHGPSAGRDLVGPMVSVACGIVLMGVLAAFVFAWLWAGARARRLGQGESTGAPLDPVVRLLLYFGSALFWPLGLISVAVLRKPENVRTGAIAFRASLVQMALVSLAVCIALPVLVAHLG